MRSLSSQRTPTVCQCWSKHQRTWNQHQKKRIRAKSNFNSE